jgi:hypothetical protein
MISKNYSKSRRKSIFLALPLYGKKVFVLNMTSSSSKKKRKAMRRVRGRGDQNTGHLDICTLIELVQKTVCS